jgi:hypothetical protein
MLLNYGSTFLGGGGGLLGGGAGLGAAGFGGATGSGTDLMAESGRVFRNRLILAISSGANVGRPFFMTERIFLESTRTRISDSGMLNSMDASRSVFICSGIDDCLLVLE